MTPTPTSSPAPLNVEALRKDFPLVGTQDQRPAHRVSRRGRLRAAAHGRHRRHEPLLRDDACQRAPRRLRHRRGGHRVVRAAVPGVRALHRRPRRGARGGLHQEHDRVAQPGRPVLGAFEPAGGRRGAPDGNGTPRQHRAVDDPVRGARRPRPALHPRGRFRAAGPRRPRVVWSTGSRSSVSRACRTSSAPSLRSA